MNQDIKFSMSLVSHVHSSAADFLAKKIAEQGLPDFVSSHGNILFQLSINKELTMSELAKRTRNNRNEFHLNDDEQYILDEKFKLSGMKSKSAFLRKLILYGYVYDVDYSYLRNYNTELGRISSSLNQIAKRINSTNHVYQEDMDEVKELMNEVWRTQKSMLLKQPLIKQ